MLPKSSFPSKRHPSCDTVIGSSGIPLGTSLSGMSLEASFFSDKHHLLPDVVLLYLYPRKDVI